MESLDSDTLAKRSIEEPGGAERECPRTTNRQGEKTGLSGAGWVALRSLNAMAGRVEMRTHPAHIP